MARPFQMVWRVAQLRLSKLGGIWAISSRHGAVNRESSRARRILAVANLAAVMAVVTYSATHGVSALGLERAALGQVGGNMSVSVLVISSLLASVLLLLSGDSKRAQELVGSTDDAPQGGLSPNALRPTDQHDDVTQMKLSSMSHDLRTPLNAIIGFSDMMQQEMHGPLGSDRYQSYATHIRDSGLAMLSAIETTLALTERLSEQHSNFQVRELSALEQSNTN